MAISSRRAPSSGCQTSYVTSQVKADRQDFGILVHTLIASPTERTLSVSVTDETTGWYKSYDAVIPKDQFIWSTKRLYITMPGLTWTGDARHTSVHATTPWGVINIRTTAAGPALNYAGTGLFQLLGDPNYEFALPALRTTGTLTIGGKTRDVTGESWLDRQWGPIPFSPSMRWTWMNLSLSNGDQIAIWDTLNSTAENSWATVLHPNGSYELAAVRPLADGASHPWTSPTSGKIYPTRWSIDIPSLKYRFQVEITGTDAQELTLPAPRMEATAAVTGRYRSEKVTGTSYVEMVGDWAQH